MSVYSAKTGVTSILKAYAPTEREKAKNAILNKVRFTMPKTKSVEEAVTAAFESDSFQAINEYMTYLNEADLSDQEFIDVMVSARKVSNDLSPKFTKFVESLLSVKWLKRGTDAVEAYVEFAVDVMVAHNKYTHFGLPLLISLWIPSDADSLEWIDGVPSVAIRENLKAVHKMIDRILTAVPMSYDIVIDTIETRFPYYKKSAHIVCGYLYNILWLLEYKPILADYILPVILKKMLILDVNAPRSEIEEHDGDLDDADDENMEADTMFHMDDVSTTETNTKLSPIMNHPIGHTLDICMSILYKFLDTKRPNSGAQLHPDTKICGQLEANRFFKQLLEAFEAHVLPSHNTHHVQFLMFYICTFKSSYAEAFLNALWHKVQNPNESAVIRQTAVGYIASFLARSKFLENNTIKNYLKELSNWAHNYIDRCDQYRKNGSLKANLVFYSVCQAVFYVIAFRSRDLTVDKKSLLFLQTLHLSALVTCNLNPLRVCIPAVATTFAGVTRTYQLAYCHAILERNARRKLATVYANETATPEETLDTFFPFDPYLLKQSSKYINKYYMQYQASEAEEHHHHSVAIATENLRRKRGDSEMIDDLDMDDFLIADKRQRLHDLARSQERDAQFTYGLSPGFQIK